MPYDVFDRIMSYDVFDRIVRVNLYGTRNVIEAVPPSMLARGSGDIVLVGSMGGIVAVYGYTAYGGSRFAVVGLAKCLRYELKPRGINVACFCPGEVETPGLAEERKSLPPAAAALKKIGGTMPVDTAVRGLIEGIRRNQFMIIPGLKVQLTYWMHRLAPDWLWNGMTDAMVAKALRGAKQAHSQMFPRSPSMWNPGQNRVRRRSER
jgi:3-dehydrosphinganine reductase